jgi:hypothetical protein
MMSESYVICNRCLYHFKHVNSIITFPSVKNLVKSILVTLVVRANR